MSDESKAIAVEQSKRRVAEIRRERNSIRSQINSLERRDEELFNELLREVAKQAR